MSTKMNDEDWARTLALFRACLFFLGPRRLKWTLILGPGLSWRTAAPFDRRSER